MPDFLEIVGTVVVVGLVLAILGCTIVLPILALVRTRQIKRLADRLERLEQEVRRLGHGAQEEPIPVAIPATSATPAEREAVPAAAAASSPGRGRWTGPVHWTPPENLETWIGRRGLGWVAVVLLLFAAAFFLKYAFENRWIGELGRVACGVVIGIVLCSAGFRFHRRGWRVFSQMLTAAGVVLLYLATYGASGYYHLISQTWASIFLTVLMAEAVALAVLYEAPAIAIMAIIGGLLTPVLLHTDRDQYLALFTYLALLDAAAAGLVLLRRWHGVATLALLGSQAVYWGWYSEHYHPEKRAAALSFQLTIFGLFLVSRLLAHRLRGWTARIEDLVRLLINAALLSVAAYVLLEPDYNAWMGTLALVLAIVYTCLAWFLLLQPPADPRHALVAVTTAMGFVALVFPLQAQATWIPVGWAAQGLALWWFGLRIRAGLLRAVGAVLLFLAVDRLLLVDTWSYVDREPFVPLFNRYALPALAIAASLLAAAVAARHFRERLTDIDRLARWSAALGGVALVWFIMSFETYTYFTAQIDKRVARASSAGDYVDAQGRPLSTVDFEEAEHLRRVGRTALSAVWSVYAVIILAMGFRLDSSPLRWMALGLFALTLGKVVLMDMQRLPGLYRVGAFLILSLMMGGAAWAYQKVKLIRLANAR
ncbi:MAG TPA: DUF2339 domain-containing protein [Gemmataceae bacterium]|nr:DUF2339 domain-containing protein [Gemmataceae bacterium]